MSSCQVATAVGPCRPTRPHTWVLTIVHELQVCWRGTETLEHLLSKAGSEPKLFLVDYWEPHKTYAYRIDTQDDKGERKQHAGRLLLYKQ